MGGVQGNLQNPQPQNPQPQDPQPQHPEGFHQHEGDTVNTYYGLTDGTDAISRKVTSIEDGKEYFYLTDETGAVRQEEGLYTYSWYSNGNKVVRYYYVTEGGKLGKQRLVTWNGNKYYIDKWGCALVNTRLWVNATDCYYFGSDGAAVKSRWCSEKKNGRTYSFYAGPEGKFYRNCFFTLGGQKYYATSSCVRAVSCRFTVKGNQYCADKYGRLYRNTFFTSDGHKRYANADGVIQRGKVITVGGKRYLTDKYGIIWQAKVVSHGGQWYYLNKDGSIDIISSKKKQTIDRYLGVPWGGVPAQLQKHRNDSYYLGTPYKSWGQSGLFSESLFVRFLNSNGRVWAGKALGGSGAGMNCAGFTATVFKDAGASFSKFGNWWGGKYVCAPNWLLMVQNRGLLYFHYNSVSAMLQSGVLQKGDIILSRPAGGGVDRYGNRCDWHIGFYYGEGRKDNVFWHSGIPSKGLPGSSTVTKRANQISQIVPPSVSYDFYVIKVTH